MLGSFERKALALAVTVIATVGVVGLGFFLLNVRSDLAVIAAGGLSLAGVVFGGARILRIASRAASLPGETDREKLP